MVKVGTVYKSEGNIDLSTLPWHVVLKIFASHMIHKSSYFSGKSANNAALQDEANKRSINEYVECIIFHMESGSYRHEKIVPFTFPIKDLELVKLALAFPQLFEYSKEIVAFDRNLVELEAIKDGVVLLRRLEQ